MSTSSNDLVHATTQIVAAYAGNPSHKLTVAELKEMFTGVHSLVSTAAREDSSSGLAAPMAAAPAALPAPSAAPSEAVARSLEGSVVHAGTPEGAAMDSAQIWPDSTPEQREKFLTLMERFGIPHGADGRPVPRKPLDKLVGDWEVVDPISGNGFKMLKRHLSVSYDLDISELRAMFHLPSDFPVTAPAYSESKRRQAEDSGLGKGPKASKKKAATPKAKTTAAKAPAAKTTTAARGRGRAKTAAAA